MAKSRARFLAELLGSDGLVKTTTSSLAGADGIIDLGVLPSIPNSKLTNSSITINSSATSLGGSVTLTTANVAENTNLYYTNARADARIAAASTSDLSEGTNLYYTDARADARVALIVDSAPGTLNTLNELAAALGDDANFSTTVTNSIATKLPLAGGTMSGNLILSHASSPTLTLQDTTNTVKLLHYAQDANAISGTYSAHPYLFYTNSTLAFTLSASQNATFAGTISSGAITSSGNITTSGTFTSTTGNRPVVVSGGAITMKGESGGWAFGLHALGSSNTNHGGFGFLGGNDAFTYYYIGETYNAGNNFRFYKNGTLQVGGTTILDSNKNITNVGTISSGAITSTGAVTGTYFSDGYVTWNGAQFNRSAAAIEFQFTPTNANWKVKIGANGDNPTEFNAYTGDADFSGEVSTPSAKLKAIAESNTDTAVDVFVYDTRKDSDGGAWRKRTQNTSWYNETLNTSTRGSRKEFPCVAVIITDTSTNTITIYDGDDPDMPMWMVFTAGSNGMASRLMVQYADHDKLVHMLNGILIIGHKTSTDNYGSPIINFISEKVVRADPHSAEGGTWLGDISTRNSASGYDVAGGSYIIINSIINDIAMTVLPNAPIDADTGLPVPTIALATAGGVSVIKDDGNVVDITVNNASYTHAHKVDFLKDNSLGTSIGVANGIAQESYYIFNSIPTTDNVITVDNIAGTTQNVDEFYAIQHPNTLVDLQIKGLDTNRKLSASTGNIFGSNEGLSIIDRKVGAPDKGLISYIASDYNTGYMLGAIKLATLSDTDTTNAVSSNMVGNGNFADTSVWGPANGATLSVSGNVGTITANGSTTQAYIGQTVTGLTVGKQYMITCDAKRGTTSAQAAITVNGILSTMTTSTSFVPLHITFTATATSQLVICFMNGSGSQSGTALFQNFTFRLAEADRSVNGASPHGGNALQVFGTVTKTAVATGAELVGYSGFSSSNYLQQPYNSDLDFGTGDFSIVGWIKPVASTTVQLILNRRKLDGSGTPIEFGVNSDETPYLYTGGGSTPLTGSPLPVGTWLHIVAVRQSGFVGIYVDGKLFNSNTGQNVNNVSLTDAHTLIGAYITNGSRQYPWQGSMALLRMSATIPSPEQIKKMYNDEKHLFQENAKATLYGTSDAVTALAYDDDTELLHVGTSAGRSVFQELNRVDNTTDAVGAAISASNGFIVED